MPLTALQSECTTFVEVLRSRAQRRPDELLYTFLLDGESDEAHATAAQLDRDARAIAAKLQSLGAAGQRALLLYAPGLEYISAFFGCLYAGVTAVPAYPPDPFRLERTLPRLRAIAADARPRLALTTTLIASIAVEAFEQYQDLGSLQWIATDALPRASAEDWRAPAIDSDSLAFLQYTSGSTAAPRGVMLTHGNLLHNSAVIRHCFEYDGSRCVFWLPPYHDMGLIGGILQPLRGGFSAVLMSPLAFLQRPVRWLEAMTKYRATLSGGPNFAYDLCVRKTTPEQRAALDLSHWELAFSGAEPVRAETMAAFSAAFAPSGFRPQAFYPCYGLAEATLMVAGGAKAALPITRQVQAAALDRGHATDASGGEESVRTLVGCGRAALGQSIRIVDSETRTRCPARRVGEIWVSGQSVALGYWGRDEDTERTFRARLASGEGPFLRTGDLGFVDENGELFVTGRLKDLIIVDGRNHYPQDIELTVEQCVSALRPGCCAAFAAEVQGEERVVVVAEVQRAATDGDSSLDAGALVESIRAAVARGHDLRLHAIVLLQPGSIPKTSSGKVQRHACRQGFLAGTLLKWGS